MGVRGLTTYIAKNSDRYLNPYELHDCNLVIDGDSLACQLYKSTNSAFGGDYDHFFRVVCNFFEMLKQCHVNSYVLLDGGYQPKKLSTVKQRLRSKVGAIKHLNPYDCQATFPILMHDVFVEAMEFCGVQFMRCIFEADDEVAALSRKLKCPVLSFDSDFYIHNVPYIPSATLVLKVFRRNIATADTHKKVRQRKKLVSEIGLDGEYCTFKSTANGNDKTVTNTPCYYYMQCSVYQIANLAREENLRTEMLPLFAILLGNDYISRSIFKKFFLNVSMKNTGKKSTLQGKRIIALLRWLKHETLSTAIDKIINHVEKEKKDWLRDQINIGIAGYVHEKSMGYEYMLANAGTTVTADMLSDDQMANQANTGQIVVNEANDSNKCRPTVNFGENESEHEIKDEDIDESEGDYNDDDDEDDDDYDGDEHFHTEPTNCDAIVGHCEYEKGVFTFVPPDWLLAKILAGKLPRYVVDLMTLRLYINAPQVENFQLPDCNRISVPILRHVFTLLHYPQHKEFRYLTRVQRRTDIEYKRYESSPIDAIPPFNPQNADNFEFFKLVLSNCKDSATVFQAIDEQVPPELRLFFIAIIFWSRHSSHFNVVYASSLVLCQIVLTTIDSKIDPIRNRLKFDKIYNPNAIKTIECDDAKRIDNETNQTSTIELCMAQVTRNECISAQSNLLDLFSLSDKIRKKHTEFSSDVIHGFAEFQSIVRQINCLNVLCGEHYNGITVSKCLNGCFLYNIYMTLKDRPNINYYIRTFLFSNAPNLFALFESMITVLTPFIQCLLKESISKRKKKRNIIKKRLREQKKLEATTLTEQNVSDTVVPEQSDSEFEDLNNKFSCLLKM